MRIFPISVIIGLLIAALTGCGDSKAPRLQAGDAAPPFTLVRLDHQSITFPDAYRGRPVIIRFWADWCPFCDREMQAIEAVYQRHRAQGLAVLAVNMTQDRATVEQFIQKIGVTYDALLDETAATANAYGVVGIPTTFFIGRDGRIRLKMLGETESALFEKLAVELLQ